MTSSENTRKKVHKPTYKDQISALKSMHSASSSYLSPTLKSKLDSYVSALEGRYEYLDSHTGKTVHARTYRKRIQFAEKELKDIESLLSLHQRYDKISDDQVKDTVAYIRSVYQVAIGDNKKAQSRFENSNFAKHFQFPIASEYISSNSAESTRAREFGSMVNSLDSRINERKSIAKTMRSNTQYAARERNPLIYTLTQGEIKQSAVAKSVSNADFYAAIVQGLSLFTGPAVVKEVPKPSNAPVVPVYEPAPAAVSSVRDVPPIFDTFGMLKEDEPSAWPVPAGWTPRKPVTFKSLARKVLNGVSYGVKVALMTGALLLPGSSTKYHADTAIPTPVPQLTSSTVPNLEAKVEDNSSDSLPLPSSTSTSERYALTSKPQIHTPAPLQPGYSLNLGFSTSSSEDKSSGDSYKKRFDNTAPEVIEMAKQRVRAAIEKSKREKAESSAPQQSLKEEPTPQRADVSTSTLPKINWKQSVRDYFGRRSAERAKREGMAVVKEVTYYPDGAIITHFPQSGRTDIIAKSGAE